MTDGLIHHGPAPGSDIPTPLPHPPLPPPLPRFRQSPIFTGAGGFTPRKPGQNSCSDEV